MVVNNRGVTCGSGCFFLSIFPLQISRKFPGIPDRVGYIRAFFRLFSLIFTYNSALSRQTTIRLTESTGNFIKYEKKRFSPLQQIESLFAEVHLCPL